MKNQKLLFITIPALLFLFSANQVLAACPVGLVPCGTSDCPCTFCDFFKLIHNIINFLLMPCPLNHGFPLIPIIAGLMLVIGGLMLMISYFSEAELLPGGAKGGPKLFSQAKKTITATVIGLVIIFVAWVFLNTFFTYIGVAKWTRLGTWWEIQCH